MMSVTPYHMQPICKSIHSVNIYQLPIQMKLRKNFGRTTAAVVTTMQNSLQCEHMLTNGQVFYDITNKNQNLPLYDSFSLLVVVYLSISTPSSNS